MKSLQNVKQALLTVTDNVYHYHALNQDAPYVVWAEDGAGEQLNADNKMTGQVIQGTIDYYTKTEYDTAVEAIQNALAAAEISFYLNSVQYEDETKWIHYEWVFEVMQYA